LAHGHGLHHRKQWKAYGQLPGNGHVTELVLKADGANECASMIAPLALFSEASFICSSGRMQIIRSEAGEGNVASRAEDV
jgi:hypothetical protein